MRRPVSALGPVRGAALVQRGCDLDNASACFALAELRALGIGTSRDESLALAANTRAEDLLTREQCGPKGSLNGCLWTTLHTKGAGGIPQAAALAPETARQACEGGDPLACQDLAQLYSFGTATLPKDPAKSAEYVGKAETSFERMCDRGLGRACFSAAQFLGAGRPGTPPDPESAAAYAKREALHPGHDELHRQPRGPGRVSVAGLPRTVPPSPRATASSLARASWENCRDATKVSPRR